MNCNYIFAEDFAGKTNLVVFYLFIFKEENNIFRWV